MHKKLFLFLVFVLVAGLSFISFAEDKAVPQENPPAATEETRLSLITAIEIKNNKFISSNTIISKMKSKVGSPYQENVASDDLKRLYLLGYFSDIKIDTQSHKGGIKIIVSVVERPVIEKISFSGIKRITMREEKLKELLKSKETQYLDYPNLSEDVETLRKMYEKMGYNMAKVQYEVSVNKETNKVKVEFKVAENKKSTIRKIVIEGNKTFTDRRILKLIKTKRAWLFNAGVLKDDVFGEDLERLKAFYRKEGFADVEVDYRIETQSPTRFIFITINIKEGKRYLVGNVTIQGNKNISSKEVLAKLEAATPGKIFSQEAMRQDVSGIQGLYFDKGYIFVQVEEAHSLNTYTGRTDITYNITENEIAYVNKIKIAGNVKTKDLVIRRELKIRPGDRFDGEKLRRSKERLQNLGFFEDIGYDTEDTELANKKDLVVDVKEAKTGAFSFGAGFSTVDQFIGFVEVEQKNFDWRNFPYFTGAGQHLRLRATIGSISNAFDLSFTEPWVFDYPITFGFDAYKREHKRDTDVGYGYDEKVLGGDLRLGKEISEYVRLDLTYRLDNIEISNISDTASNDLKKEYGKNTISSLEFALSYDSRDNVFNPRKGNVLAGSIACAGGPFAGDKDYVKFFGRASHYVPLGRNSVLEFRGRVGAAEPFSDSKELPIYERFFAGGADTVRGYEERMIGPVDPASNDPLGGNSMLIGNIEYTYPLFDFLKVAAFADAGNVWSKLDDMGKGTIKKSIGFGFRIKTPIGPIMLDYGIPLDKVSGEDKRGPGRFHFSVSHGF
ncbi:MAG: outer membrane protein assembly factor BamA [Omnitrophica WOR_2 bacterium RBG_13_41_10]|nr:MAG: outer membrane protein assembly factor BamA [Omnitrophica WOR_2 bacterium RBG_13_41_10]